MRFCKWIVLLCSQGQVPPVALKVLKGLSGWMHAGAPNGCGGSYLAEFPVAAFPSSGRELSRVGRKRNTFIQGAREVFFSGQLLCSLL